jgi:hypothetical protein
LCDALEQFLELLSARQVLHAVDGDTRDVGGAIAHRLRHEFARSAREMALSPPLHLVQARLS